MKDDAIGREVDGYRIEGVLGRGGMGVVYKGTDVALSRPVALKRINPGQSHREAFLHRFRAEARALARINSPNIVSIYALRETNIGLLIVMEYVDGGTVSDRIDGPMAVPTAVPFLRQILSAFDDAHEAEVIHRDIKPQNLLLTQNGVVKVTDFGIAKMRRQDSGETVTQGGQGGTLKYMSPEQISDVKAVDNRSDLYSIGMTAYQMLAGRLPFGGSDTDFDIMRKVVEGQIPSPGEVNPALPKSLVRWLIRSIQKQPADRYQSASEMADALEDAIQGVDAASPAGTNRSLSDAEVAGPTMLDDGTRLDEMSTVLDDGETPTQTSMPDPDALPDAAEDATIMDTDAEDATVMDMDAGDATVTSAGDVGPGASFDADTAPNVPHDATEADATAAAEFSAAESSSGVSDTASPPAQETPSKPKDDSQKEDTSSSKGPLWVALAAVGVLLVAGAYWMLAPSGNPSATAALSLQTAPTGATVIINGDTVGTTPLQGHTLAAGPLTLTLQKPGHVTFDTTFRAQPGEVYRTSARLPAAPVADAAAGQDAGAGQGAAPSERTSSGRAPSASAASPSSSPSSDAPAGTASTGSTADDASASSASADAPNTTAASSGGAAAAGTLAFDVQPSGALYVNGTREGASGQVRVPPGTQQVSCRNASYGRIDTTLAVSSGTTESVACYFEQEVNVTAIGGWGNIWLNGENTGRRTGGGSGVFRLPPGTHTFSLPLQRSGVTTTGVRYQVRTDDTVTQRRSLDGSEITIRIRPSFAKKKHAVVFQVTRSGS